MGGNAIFLITVISTTLLLSARTVSSIQCYQCDSTNSVHPFQCTEYLTDDVDITPQSCDDVFGAKYCVKHTGRFEVSSLDCYQCASADEWKCSDGEMLIKSSEPINCSHVFGARYCIKTTGQYGGGIGTKRFCSSNDLGNYCDYVKQPGDKLTYRTCVFTCNGDGCNPASGLTSTWSTWIVPIFFLMMHRLLLER